jgi:hypothetical protein
VAEITEATRERRGVGMSPLLVSAWKHKPRPQSLDRLAGYARYCFGLQYVAKAGGWASIRAHGVDDPKRAKQFGALLTPARESPNPCDFTLVAMLGLLGLRIFEPPAPTSATLAKNTATGYCAYAAKGPGSS